MKRFIEEFKRGYNNELHKQNAIQKSGNLKQKQKMNRKICFAGFILGLTCMFATIIAWQLTGKIVIISLSLGIAGIVYGLYGIISGKLSNK